MESENREDDKANALYVIHLFRLRSCSIFAEFINFKLPCKDTTITEYQKDHAKDHRSTPKLKTQEGPNAWFGSLLAQRRDTFDC